MTELPHWEQTPSDLPTATKEIKAALRERIAASGRTVEEVVRGPRTGSGGRGGGDRVRP